VSIAVINFGVNIALARMLTKADFGLLSMIGIFTAIAADLSGCGLSDGLIQKPNPTEKDYSTVFVFNAGVGLIFGLAFFFGAPLIASYFGHHELVEIMRVYGVCFFFQTMSYVQETRLKKLLKMKTMCFVRVGATITASGLGVAAAALGYGYRALVCSQILLSFFFFLYYTLASRWFPKLTFDRKSFKELFSYGVHLMIAYLATIIGKNINPTVLGKLNASAAFSGIYYQGAKLANVPFNVSELSLNSPFFVVASNETDPDRQRSLIRRMLTTIVSVNTALLMLMLVIAAPGIELLYGDEWLGAIPIFRIMAVCEFLVCLRLFFGTICKVHARTSFVRNMSFAEVILQLGLLVAFHSHGIIWIVWTQAVAVAVATVAYMLFCRRYIAMTLTDMGAALLGGSWLQGVGAAVAAVALWGADGLPSWVRCAVVAAVYGGTIVAIGELLRPAAYTALRSRLLRRQA
ncbi:MAG: lipopolysaccharide biosynthesis protein, partial [Muribaculaceae bacterium]|nr:lipopolysaccharide biosynthesis protein [Muribaculaceae bacterium]